MEGKVSYQRFSLDTGYKMIRTLFQITILIFRVNYISFLEPFSRRRRRYGTNMQGIMNQRESEVCFGVKRYNNPSYFIIKLWTKTQTNTLYIFVSF